VTKRRPLEERIEWLETFPHRMTVGTLLRALRIVARLPELQSTVKKEAIRGKD
jgi:hypothetical protein